MKNLPATHFPELITSLDYENPIKRNFLTPPKKYTSGRQNNQLCIKLVKTDQRQGNSPDRERSENSISRKVKPKSNLRQKQKCLWMRKNLLDTEVQELLRKWTIIPAPVSEDQFVSDIFSETEKKTVVFARL